MKMEFYPATTEVALEICKLIGWGKVDAGSWGTPATYECHDIEEASIIREWCACNKISIIEY